MNVSIGNKVYSVTNWSPGGMLVTTDPGVLEKGRIEEGELLMPCTDGVFLLRVQIHPLHWQGAGCGCRFVDIPPRERAILHHYADAVARGISLNITQLEESGRFATYDSPPPEATLEKHQPASRTQRFLRMSPKRALMMGALAIVILLAGSYVVPHFVANVVQKGNAKAEYLRAAKTRLQNGELALSDLSAKIEIVRGLLSKGKSANGTANTEQIKILELGLKQLSTERDVLSEQLDSLRTNIEDTENSRFFFINPFLSTTAESRADPAPYVTSILRDLASSNGMEPRGQGEIDKYLLVAESRVKQAEYTLSAAKIKREALEKIVKRVTTAGSAAGFPANQLDLMKRDMELLKLEEERLTDLLILLQDNVTAVKAGNFTYELKLLQKFDSQPTRASDESTDRNLVR